MGRKGRKKFATCRRVLAEKIEEAFLGRGGQRGVLHQENAGLFEGRFTFGKEGFGEKPPKRTPTQGLKLNTK